LLAGVATTGGRHALAQEAVATCAPAIARVVSLQGNVEVQRGGSQAWLRIRRLDTSICAGDRLRTASLSRAALFVQPETLVRVDQNTTITLNQTTTEILVEFFQDDVAQVARDAQSCGAGYFITRFPKKFRVSTPHVNAAVEGTEFMVELSCKTTELTVLEGAVLSETPATREERTLTSGQKLVAGPTSPAAFSTLIKPVDAVQWVLHYPPLSDAKAEADIPAAEECHGLSAPSNQTCLTQRAEVLLRLGRIDEALRDIDAVLALDSGNGDANALRAIIQIAKNDKVAAVESAKAATASTPNNYRAWLALSYAQQASFDLDEALAGAKRAQALEQGGSLVHARVAELLLSLGRSREAEASAHAGVNANPADSRAHTMLGFVHLTQVETKRARADFEAAIERDSFSPLPRLGLGLVMIRDGELVGGREQIEIAVALDPANSLLRSYAGKAYYEENSKERDQLASTQFALAKELDRNDPTPWFYDAILKYSQTRPAEAILDLDKSADLNDDRAVYRSRQQLDADLAARNVSQATVYNELGFHQLGLTEAAHSLAVDPASGSAHRFLADIYATVPRYDIARASELLQAQLRQPLGASPLQPQLANDVLFRNTFFGPAIVGLNEFNPLFIHNDQEFQLFGLLGDNNTYGNQAIFGGLHGPVSFSLSQFAADTDGYRANNDDRLRQYDGFVQAQFGANTSAQVEVTSADRESGDLQSAFDPDFFSEAVRNEEELDTQRLGIRHVIDSQTDVLVSVIRQDRQASLDDPDFPVTIITEQDSWKAEAQYLTSRGEFDVIVGASYFEGESEEELITPFFSFATQSTPRHINAYAYIYLPAPASLPQVQVGVSYDDLTSDVGEQSEVNPKIGATWKVADSLTLRAAGFRVLKRRINSDQGLEPTQLAGLNQFFDDRNGAVSEGGGLAADFKFSPLVSGGLQVTRRNLTVPFFDFAGEVFFQRQREDVASGYLYWLPGKNFSVSFEPRYHDFDVGATFEKLELTEAPLTVRFASSSGLWAGVSVTAVRQSGEFQGPGGFDVAGSDSFWLVDAIVAYRLPRRMGTVSLQATNLFNEKFQFQEIDQAIPPRYVPESQFVLRVSIGL
jgi:Tfp pilus assembly protein PilF